MGEKFEWDLQFLKLKSDNVHVMILFLLLFEAL